MTKNKLLLYLLCAILFIAGIVHLISPEFFLPAMPPYLPWHLEIIYITGVIEIVLVLGLLIQKYRYWASIITAVYFIAIFPAHIHIAINDIPMFGIYDPIVLWGRVVFQFVFIYWAWSLRNLNPKEF